LRASGDRRECRAQAATHRPSSWSPAGAEPDPERPAPVRIWVAFPPPRTNPKGRHRPSPRDAPDLHRALVRRKYRRLFSSTPRAKKSGPKGPDAALIQASSSSGRAILGSAVHGSRASSLGHSGSTSTRTSCTACWRNTIARLRAELGPSWLSVIGHTRDSLWSVDWFRCESIVLRSYWV
jgi:hypothetical protein